MRAGAARSAIPVELELRLDESLPPAIEAAAYYVCAEAVTNAIKHARCSRVWVSLVHVPGTLTVEVRDDGVGGASMGEGTATGLCGLKDRVEALDGSLTVESATGEGTRLVAVFPAWRGGRHQPVRGHFPLLYALRSDGCRTQRQLPPTETACMVAVVTPSSEVTRTVTALDGRDFAPTSTGSS